MHYIIVFLINLLALNFRLWLFQSIFHRKRSKRMIFILVIIMGIISSLTMLLYPYVLTYLDISSFSPSSLTWQNIALLISYVGGIGLLLSLLGKKVSFEQKLVVRSVALITLAAGVAIGVLSLPLGILLYFLCVAGAEEFLKLSVSQGFFAQFKISKKDLLLFAVLSAIGFALIENFIYLFNHPNIGLAVGRNLTTVIMHIIFTGSMAYIIMTRSGHNRGWYIIAFLVGMLLHRGYNSFMSYNNPRITAGIIIIGYFIISYFLYKSDRLYLGKQ